MTQRIALINLINKIKQDYISNNGHTAGSGVIWALNELLDGSAALEAELMEVKNIRDVYFSDILELHTALNAADTLISMTYGVSETPVNPMKEAEKKAAFEHYLKTRKELGLK